MDLIMNYTVLKVMNADNPNIKIKIREFSQLQFCTKAPPFFKDPAVLRDLSAIHEKFVVVPAD